MKLHLVTLIALALGISAEPNFGPVPVGSVFGPSGVVTPDGRNIQFPADIGVILAGPSGVVTKSGNIQFRAKRSLAPPASALFGPSGWITKEGGLRQLTHAEADSIILIGPSGVITKNGPLQRQKRSTFAAPLHSIYGPSGIITPDGKLRQFTAEEASQIILIGPSGVITKGGPVLLGRKKRSLPLGTVYGPSGFVTPDGRQVQFSAAQAGNFVLGGPSGVVTKDGNNIQFIRKKRSPQDVWGESGVIFANGQQVQFKTAGVKVLLDGPSGILLSDGSLVQKTGRKKRSPGHVWGPSGVILKDGGNVQFKEAGVKILLEGPSGYIFSDGSLAQKTG